MIAKKTFLILIFFLLLLTVSCSSRGLIEDKNQKETKSETSLESSNSIHVDYAEFNGFDLPKDNVIFTINGEQFQMKSPIYLDKNRYYLCLNELIEKLNGKMNILDNLIKITFNNKSYTIDLDANTVSSPNDKLVLKKSLLTKNDIHYINFSDLSNMLDLYTRWDKDTKTIHCKINDSDKKFTTPYESKIDQIGLIRFEDIGLTSQTYSKEYFEKLRIIANYMYQKEIPYHIAWIPRYMIPALGVDNDPMTKNNFEIAEMIYSLDYFTSHNGIIGLHGYTHQLDNTESGVGFEFGKYAPSEDNFNEKIQKAITTASYLDIPIDFFEAPHYEITPAQNRIAEKYFKILYYPYNDHGEDKADLTKPEISPYNKSTIYISTPLNYIPEGREDQALAKMKEADLSKMGSVFYHPLLEDKYISLTVDNDNSPTFTYEENSILKRLINTLEEKGFKLVKVTDL